MPVPATYRTITLRTIETIKISKWIKINRNEGNSSERKKQSRGERYVIPRVYDFLRPFGENFYKNTMRYRDPMYTQTFPDRKRTTIIPDTVLRPPYALGG